MIDTSSMSSVQSRIANGLSTCQTRTPAWLNQLAFMIINCGDTGSMTTTNGRRSPAGVSRPPRMRGHGKKAVSPNGPLLLREYLPREANLFLLIRPSVQNPEEKGLPWKDIDEMDTSHEFLYPDDPAVACPVVKADQLSPEQQVAYIQWICHILKLDHKASKDPRVYCAYCDMNNHPRFTCKHAWKHRNPTESSLIEKEH